MNQYVDLHVHTNMSDGSDSVVEILSLAQDNNISVLSITDHNTLDAYSDSVARWIQADQGRYNTLY